MNDNAAAARGHRAFNELEELKDAFERLEKAMFREIKQTPMGSDAKLQRLHAALHVLTGVQTAMREMINNGLIAEQALAVAGLNRPN